MTSAPPTLSIEGLSLAAEVRSQRVQPVTDAHVIVHSGEIVGLVGESGSGKTLTALAVSGLLPDNVTVSGGSIHVAGHNMLTATTEELIALRGAAIGMVFQDSLASLNPTMTIGKQVSEVIRLHTQEAKGQAQKSAIHVLNSVGLPQPKELFDSFPHQLSGGMRQRVAIAIAIACEPHLIIADEPTTALDVTVQAQILELLRTLADDRGIGVLLITHDLGVVASVADRTTVMYGGRTVETCSVFDAFEVPQHPYTHALVASAPTLSGTQTTTGGIPGSQPDPSHPEPGCPFAPRCHYATDSCLDTAPPLIQGQSSHSVACFHPLNGSTHE